MNYGRFFSPYVNYNFTPWMITNNLTSNTSFGFLSRFVNSIRRFNWNGLITGANKTLNVVNQSIPLIRQTGPIVNNMKNMFKIARIFGNETSNKNSSGIIENKFVNKFCTESKNNCVHDKKNEVLDGNYPNFFV